MAARLYDVTTDDFAKRVTSMVRAVSEERESLKRTALKPAVAEDARRATAAYVSTFKATGGSARVLATVEPLQFHGCSQPPGGRLTLESVARRGSLFTPSN